MIVDGWCGRRQAIGGEDCLGYRHQTSMVALGHEVAVLSGIHGGGLCAKYLQIAVASVHRSLASTKFTVRAVTDGAGRSKTD